MGFDDDVDGFWLELSTVLVGWPVFGLEDGWKDFLIRMHAGELSLLERTLSLFKDSNSIDTSCSLLAFLGRKSVFEERVRERFTLFGEFTDG